MKNSPAPWQFHSAQLFNLQMQWYGLGNAPRGWWLSVDKIWESQTGRRTTTVGVLSRYGPRTTRALVTAQDDDFIITNVSRAGFDKLRNFRCGRCRCGSLDNPKFWLVWDPSVSRKIAKPMRSNLTNCCTRTLESIPHNVNTGGDLDRPLTQDETTRGRGVFGRQPTTCCKVE